MTAPPRVKTQSPWHRRLQRWGMGCLRLLIIAAAMLCLFVTPSDEAVDLDAYLQEGKKVFAQSSSLGEAQEGWYPLLSADGELCAWVTTTNPQARKVQGYAGPSVLLVIADANRKIVQVKLWQSADTAGHVEIVRRDQAYWSQWNGKSEVSLGVYETPRLVSGASLTSDAMARGLAARFGAQGLEQYFQREIAIADVTPWIAGATSILPTAKPGCYEIRDTQKLLGRVLHSSRQSVSLRGYNGSSDVIVALDTNDQLLGVAMIDTRDNEPYMTDIRDELRYTNGFAGKSIEQILGTDEYSDTLLVSGASMTARAVYGTVQEMLRRYQYEESPASIPWQWSVSLTWLAAGMWFGFRGGKKSRAIFAVCSVLAGVALGWMLGQDQLIGWARHGWESRPALPLLTLTAIALLVPAFTGKNVYCSRICPHGAAQTLAGMALKKRFALPPKLHRVLSTVPWLTLLVIWALALAGSRLPFAHAEPFEVWSTGFVALLPAILFTIGIVAAFFLPQGYCHYGCPTGALLKFLTHAPGRWTKRDSIAVALVGSAWIFVML